MAGIASLAKSKGFKVTGCDQNVYPPMSTQLEEQEIEIIEGFNPSQVELNPDIYIVGNIVKRGNPLMETILNEGLTFQSGPQWLYENILHEKWIIAIAGKHGNSNNPFFMKNGLLLLPEHMAKQLQQLCSHGFLSMLGLTQVT